MQTTARPTLDARTALAEALSALGRELLDGTTGDGGAAARGLESLAVAVRATLGALVQVEPDETATAVREWRRDRASTWGLEALPALPAGEGAAHKWGGKLAAQLGVAGVSVVPVSASGRDRWALLLGWPDRARIWDEGWVPLLVAAGALLVGAEGRLAAESRPTVDEWTGVANRKLFLVMAGRMLARLDRARAEGLALLACQAPLGAEIAVGGAETGSAPSPVPGLITSLEGRVRESDLVGQFDERTIVLACEGVATSEDALALAGRLAAVLAPAPGEDAPVRLSWGVAHTTVRVAPGVLLRRADTAAYQAAVTGQGVALADL